jgi:hypothetical protein
MLCPPGGLSVTGMMNVNISFEGVRGVGSSFGSCPEMSMSNPKPSDLREIRSLSLILHERSPNPRLSEFNLKGLCSEAWCSGTPVGQGSSPWSHTLSYTSRGERKKKFHGNMLHQPNNHSVKELTLGNIWLLDGSGSIRYPETNENMPKVDTHC